MTSKDISFWAKNKLLKPIKIKTYELCSVRGSLDSYQIHLCSLLITYDDAAPDKNYLCLNMFSHSTH